MQPYSDTWNRAQVRRPNMLMVNPHPSASSQGYMAKHAAEQIADQAAYLHEELEREAQIPAWMEAALTRAKHHLDGVAGYLGLHTKRHRHQNAAALVQRTGCCEPCVAGSSQDCAVARPSDIPPWACHGPAQPTRCPPYAVKSSAVPRQQNAVWPWVVGGAAVAAVAAGGGLVAYNHYCRDRILDEAPTVRDGKPSVVQLIYGCPPTMIDNYFRQRPKYFIRVGAWHEGISENETEARWYFDQWAAKGRQQNPMDWSAWREDQDRMGPAVLVEPGPSPCCSSCARGGSCEGGCGDKCTKGCSAKVRNKKRTAPARARKTTVGRLLNHAAGMASAHAGGGGSYYAKQNAWQLASHGEKINEVLTGQEQLPDWVEHKLYETSQIVDELAHRVAYIRHTGHPLMAHNGEPDAVP